MTNFIALLRGVNVSGQKKMPMADLRVALEKLNFRNVRTYIQSGNVVFGSTDTDKDILEKKIKDGIRDVFGFDVPVLVKSKSDFERVIVQNPYTDKEAIEKKQVYFVLLKNTPAPELVKAFQNEAYENEKFFVSEDCVYLFCQTGYGKAKLNNNLIERKLKVEATTRNYRTMMKLFEMSGK